MTENTQGARNDFSLGVFVSSIQPLTLRNYTVIADAIEKNDHVLLVIDKSDHCSDYLNPFTLEERTTMVRSSFPNSLNKLTITDIPTCQDMDIPPFGWFLEQFNIKINKFKDIFYDLNGITIKEQNTNFYPCHDLAYSPTHGWQPIPEDREESVPADQSLQFFRETYFADDCKIPYDLFPDPVSTFLEGYRNGQAFKRLVRERKEIESCRAKYPGTNYTGDILILHRGQSLLIRRGGPYGHLLYAFPGGIRDKGEDQLDCSLRELDEETGMTRLNPEITIELLKSWVITEVYRDTEGRDLRGDYRTTLFAIQIPDEVPPLKIKAADDAYDANFTSPDLIPNNMFFADHRMILNKAMKNIAENVSDLEREENCDYNSHKL